MKRYWAHIVASTEQRVKDFLLGQVKDDKRTDFGRMESDILEGKPTVYLLTDCLCLYFCEESRFYLSETLWDAIVNGVGFLERWQREDGSMDFPSCNFFSAPDTAFCFRRLYGAWQILEKYGTSDQELALKDRYFAMMLKCEPILLYGGFHTPNHRWAVTAALLSLAKLEKDEKRAGQLRLRAEQYLAEGIDGDEDGEYAERSTGNYNAVVDKSLILAYESTQDESFLQYVERNLTAMLYYIDGDDTIFTQNSTRQDHGKRLYPEQYFYLYTWMAEKTGSLIFDAAAHKMICDNQRRGDLAPDCMYIFMTHDALKNHQFQGYGYLPEYRKFFRGSRVLRVKKAAYAYTVLANKADFLYLKSGGLSVGLRIGESYCDIRNFIPQKIELEDDTCTLSATALGWYYQPFGEYQGTTDWWKMDHQKREKVITSTLDTKVVIRELENGLEITVLTSGLSGLPLRVEIDVPADCVLENDTFRLTASKGGSVILKKDSLTIAGCGEQLSLGPGFGTHSFGGHYSGEEKNTEGFSVFMNDYTPCERTFRIVTGSHPLIQL